MTLRDLWGMAPELILTLAALTLLFPKRYTLELGLAGLLGGLVALLYVPRNEAFFLGAFLIDDTAFIFHVLFLAVAFLVLLGAATALPTDRQKEFSALLLFATMGMMGVAAATDLITLFISFELASISTYVLAGYRRSDERSIEAATKYFIIGALSSALALYGISLLYGVAGTLSLRELAAGLVAAETPSMYKVGLVLVFAGFGFKITAVPFHLWAPDVYEGAPTPVTALLAAGSKKMGFAALFKVFLVGLLAFKADWALLLGAIAVLTMTVGNLLALGQSSVKRMLAYSSIAHAGYILIAFPVATAYGWAGGLFQIITHAIMTAGAFLVVAAVSLETSSTDFAAYRGLARRQPALAFAQAIFLLSLVGIPPLAGFQSKFVLFASAVEAGLQGERWLLALAAAGVLNSALSLYYYARLLKTMFAEEPLAAPVRGNPGFDDRLSPVALAPLHVAVAIALTLVLLLGLYPGPVLDVLLQAARAMF